MNNNSDAIAVSNHSDAIAVIGMSGRFPGANSVSQLWENLCANRVGIRTLSDEELRAAGVPERDLADSTYVKASAMLDDIDKFDAGFFKISPLEAEILDPQVRLLLQCAWEALEDGGHARKDAQNIGVFAGAGGVTTSYFSHFVNVNERFEKITASPAQLGNDKDFLATYISYRLNLTGPSVTVQTACSTSLVALHQARSSVLNGECDMALAGGVTIRVPHGQGYHHKEGYIFSSSGRVKTFDESADGVVFGSGLGLVLIRKLSDAIRGGDNIYAVIKGSAVTNDGKGKMSYAASSARGQIACVRAALRNAAIDPSHIGFIESHGTATSMGDPEEVKALAAVFKEHTDKKGYCALGAVKTHIGHTEAAAGIIGFIKAVLAVKHGVIPPVAHYTTPNPRIKLENTPFYINRELQTWDQGKRRPRAAAINSLGVGGTNAFVIVEQHIPPKLSKKKNASGPCIVPLSAKTEVSLRAYARKLTDFLASSAATQDAIDLAETAYTLQIGRDAMERRAAFVVSTVDELRTSLEGYLQGTVIEPSRGEAAELADAWVKGGNVDWLKLYPEGPPRRISLPTYVFAKDRYWIDSGSRAPSRAVIHPLLHTNTSDLSEQKYTATFTGEELFLRDHQVRAQLPENDTAQLHKVFPGVAYLEMARAAIEQAATNNQDAGKLELHNVVWIQPLIVSADKQVNIAVLPRVEAGQKQRRIEFEIYTQDELIHCQGHGVLGAAAEGPAQTDLTQLRASMRRDRWSAEETYAAFNRMGLNYGPSHRSIAALEKGDGQLLADLALPQSVVASESDYVLHPSLMDGALQAAAGLLFDPRAAAGDPIVPFALETLRMLAPCKRMMHAWARFARGSQATDKAPKLDIDLLDAAGNVCVQILGYAPRLLSKESRGSLQERRDSSPAKFVRGSLLAVHEWQQRPPARNQTGRIEQRVVVCDFPHVDVDKIAPHGATLWLTRGKNVAERYAELALVCFETTQALLKSRPQVDIIVQVVLPNTDEHLLSGGLAGLFKTARLENPRVAGQVIFVDAATGTHELAKLLHHESCRPDDTVIRYAGGDRQVMGWRVLENETLHCAFDTDGPFKDQGVYLITGGLGGLGTLFAEEILARTSSPKIILTGRGAPADVEQSASKRAILESLRARGATVDYLQLDLHNREQVEAKIAGVHEKYRQLNGIIHSAGMTSDSFILKKTAEEFRGVLLPKTLGTHHLDLATRDIKLDFMALFSSLTSAVGNLGQADYAAANGFMDEFAAYRNRLVRAGQRQGLTLAVRWPLWQDGGMQVDAAGRDRLHETTGTHPMQTATGMRMFYRSLTLGVDNTLIMEGDVPLMQRTLGNGSAAPSERVVQAVPSGIEAAKLAAASGGDLGELTERYLCQQLSSLLKLAPDRIDSQAPLEDFGIDSILALDLTRMLEKDFGPLPKTLFFEYLTMRQLADYFIKAHAGTLSRLFAVADSGGKRSLPQASEPVAQVSELVPQALGAARSPGVSIRARGRRFAEAAGSIGAGSVDVASQGAGSSAPTCDADPVAAEPIAIIGLSGRYPESPNLQAFWHQLRDGKDCIVEVPKARWDWREYYSEDRSAKGRHYSRWGGFIEGVDEFDARFFNISPAEAETIDPQERLFLEHAWMAMEDAGCTRATMQIPQGNDLAGRVGVYAGVMYGEYQLLGAEASLLGERVGFASNLASIANRVSYVLNLHGPSMTVDTMCSSSLTAIHLACQDLRLGQTSLAIAGGVNVTIHPNKYLMLSAGQFISGDGHCQSFGEGGDGYIPGEGVGVVVLKRLSDAQRDGNHIYGLIRGSGLSHGGKTNGYTVPNPQAQASAIRQALAAANVDPRHISYIEAHGTGTKLGDPIEIAALSKVFQESTQDQQFCLIGSVKSNIGHCEAAAGIAGLTKVLLQLEHGYVVPSLHSSRLNPHIDFERTPFVVNQSLRAWESPVIDGKLLPRIAGISSFGAGGSNAHLIVEEYPQTVGAAEPQGDAEAIVPLSARTAEQLRQKARDLLDFIRGATPAQLTRIAYTLQVGREAMDERLAIVASSVSDLANKLQAHLDGDGTLDGIYPGQVKANKEALSWLTRDADLNATVGKWIADRKHAKLAQLWARGLSVDWQQLHAVKPGLMSLPTYPFARQRYWVDVAATARRPKTGRATVLHPLLHENTSDFHQQSYATRFAGDEPFLTGSPGERRLSEAASLEMVRAAIETAMPSQQDSTILELCDVAWAQPGLVVANKQVTVALFDKDDEQVKFEIYTRDELQAQEVVHCQGVASYKQQPMPPPVDLAALIAQDRRQLVELPLPVELEGSRQEYVIHPALLQTALEEAGRLAGEVSEPLAMAALRVIFPCTNVKFAWVRHSGLVQASNDRSIDIDLCDERGNVCLQARGIRYSSAASSLVEGAGLPNAPADESAVAQSLFSDPPRPVAFGNSETPHIPETSHDGEIARHRALPSRPSRSIVLAPPAGLASLEPSGSAPPKTRVSLVTAVVAADGQAAQSRATVCVGLFDHGNGVFSIRVDASANGGNAVLSGDVIDNVLRAMRTVEDTSSAKVLMIEGGEEQFLTGGLEEYRAAVASQLYRAICEFPYPVIAVARGSATGAGFLLAAICDFMVCSEAARYAFAVPEDGLFPLAADPVLNERFGRALATDFLYFTPSATGTELKSRGWTCPIVPPEQVVAYAQRLAVNLARKSQLSLSLLKRHLASRVTGTVQSLSVIDTADRAALNRGNKAPLSASPSLPDSPRLIRAPSPRLWLDAHGDRALVVTICAEPNGLNAKDLLADLATVFAQIDEATPYRCVVLASELPEFLPDVGGAVRADLAQGFKNALQALNRPVVAALNANASGIAWYVSQFCDACVYSEKGRYTCAELLSDPAHAADAVAVFSLRFGAERAKEILSTGGECSGAELREQYGAIHVLNPEQVRTCALQLADALAAFPTSVLVEWKKRTAAIAAADVADRGCSDAETLAHCNAQNMLADTTSASPVPVSLRSKVITAIAHPGGILEVCMADREAKNMFSDALSSGMREVFAHIQQSNTYKVIVLTGYDNYFSSGATPDTLLAIHQGKLKFTDNDIFQLPLDCPVPVIAAMQGHGIGAGWALGMYADITLFSEESRYLSPYMGYGFTPGAGSTLIFPQKIGYDLARETLFTAQEYSGAELKERGLRNPVIARESVAQAALALARRIAKGSTRSRLVALKRHWTGGLQNRVRETFERELEMHERTFVGQADTLARIQHRLRTEATPIAQAARQSALPTQAVRQSTSSPQASGDSLPNQGLDIGALTADLKTLLAQELRMPESEIAEDEQFVNLGLDSITGVTWIRRINEKYGTAIEAIKVYSYPTLGQLSAFVAEEAMKAGTLSASTSARKPAVVLDTPPAVLETPVVALEKHLLTVPAVAIATSLTSWRDQSRSKATAAPRLQSIAVIGMAGQFPQARNLEEFWSNISQGKDCIQEIPRDRWDVNLYYQEGETTPGKTYSRWMGLLEEYDLFDAAFFNISPREARSMDPQQRLFLQTCWQCIEHAGYNPKSLSGSKCGVFAGATAGDYHQQSQSVRLSGQGFTGAAPSILAARISYFLDLHGPSLSIDTACSSSLVAIASACDSLFCGGSDIALAGGVNVMSGPAMQIMTAQVGMLSPQGRCFTFDERANGIASSEGVGVVMLKRLVDAQRDGDSIYGVVEGWGVNQDGKTNGITAPNADSQTRLQQDVYEKFRIDPATIQLIEAHGTGTALGDPIEVAGLKAAFRKYTQSQGYCALGSVKSNIGHCLTAAGVSGFLKVLLALQHKQLPPTIHFRKLNKHISLDDSPFYISDRLREWKQAGREPRRAAINAFGFSGTNAHVVIAEYRHPHEFGAYRDVRDHDAPMIIPLSAKTADQLKRRAQDLLGFVRARDDLTYGLRDLAYTLQVGREEMSERAAFIVGTVRELQKKLEAFVGREESAGVALPKDVYQGQVTTNKDTLVALGSDPDFQSMIGKWIGRGELAKLADLWVKGLRLNWREFYAAVPEPRRTGLPGYPFAKERHWIDVQVEERAALAATIAVHATAPTVTTAVQLVAAPAVTTVQPAAAPPAKTTVQLAAAAHPRAATRPAVAVPPVPAPRAAAQPSVSRDQLQQQLRASLAGALFMKPADVDVRKSFVDLGLDSIIGVEWVKALNKQYGTELSATRVYDYPTVSDLAAFLHTQMSARNTDSVALEAVPAAPSPAAPSPAAPARPRFSREELQQQLQASLAEALFMKSAEVDVNKSFVDLGLDSIIGVEWTKSLNRSYGTHISAIKVYDYPNIKSLASFLIEAIDSSQGAAPAPVAGAPAPAMDAAASAVSAPGASERTRSDANHVKGFEDLYFRSLHSHGDVESDSGLWVQYAISPENNVSLKEHVVFGQHLLPTDAYIELVHCALRDHFSAGRYSLKNIIIGKPILGTRGKDTYIRVVFRRMGEDLQFFIKSSQSADFDDEKLHVHGSVVITDDRPASRFDSGIPIARELESAEIPTNAGEYYAPLLQLQFGDSAALGRIRIAAHDFKFVVNPFVLYGGLCTAINYAGYLAERHYGAGDDQFLPCRIGQVTVLDEMEESAYRCYAEARKVEADEIDLYFEIVDGMGNLVLVVDSISLRRVGRQTLAKSAAASVPAGAVPAAVADRPRADDVAIIGMSCRYPMSRDADAFWENLKAGRDCVTEVPTGRWSGFPDWHHPDPRHPHTSYSKWGGFLDNIDAFDALFFGISPAEAQLIDPQQRIFLEECWKAIESAGYAPGELSGLSCGVYVGCSTGDYARVLSREGQDTAGAAFMGTSSAILAGRTSYYLNLKGPALAIDTACSSSLVAVHLACESIRGGENQLALAGGVNVLTTPLGHILTSQVGMPSRDGRCSAFDASANGIVFSEGCGVLLLKPLSRARQDNDIILGVIRASGINQDGKTNGITAPSSNAQEQLLRQVYGRFGIDAKQIGYVEAHGTATPLGDPIEVNALTSVFRQFTAEKHYCALGSVKSNIGHSGFAAGVAGIAKVLLCMKHRQLVPSIHYSNPNPHIDFDSSPFYVNTQCQDWISNQPRLASVSSFGFSGTNAHVVIEEYVPASEPVDTAVHAGKKCVVPLSAKAPEQLQQKAQDLLDFIRNRQHPLSLARAAYTLQLGRDAMEHRLAFIADSLEQLAEKLQGYIGGNAHGEGVYSGGDARGQDTLAAFAADPQMRTVIERWIEQRNLSKLADLWVRGFDLTWDRLYDAVKPQRMSLPTYPFAKERCWVEPATSHQDSGFRQRSGSASALATLHPLLHYNVSDLSQQSYDSKFVGNEFFLTDHRVKGEKVLPAVAYLEMARAAIENALPAQDSPLGLELRHIVWAQPIVVSGEKNVSIGIFSESDEQVDFEVHSESDDNADRLLHCQGSCLVGGDHAVPKLDLEALRAQVSRTTLEGGALYPLFAELGLDYGPAFQAITAIHKGEDQLLAELSLPDAVRASAASYTLHPSLMDGALQVSISLIEDAVRASGSPWVPFALESLRSFSACSERMVAWVRYSQGAHAQARNLIKVDIDLCDLGGNVCVQMRGFASRPMEGGAGSFDEQHYRAIIAGVVSHALSADQAVELE